MLLQEVEPAELAVESEPAPEASQHLEEQVLWETLSDAQMSFEDTFGWHCSELMSDYNLARRLFFRLSPAPSKATLHVALLPLIHFLVT